MAVCFICNAILYGEQTSVSSITPCGNAPYSEIISELVGEKFVVIVTPADHMCNRCTSRLTSLEKIQNDMQFFKNALLFKLQMKYGILPGVQPIASIDVVNGNIRTDDLEISQRRAPRILTFREPSTSAGGSNAPTRTRQDPSMIKIYKCGFCPFQSKDLGHVRFHMRAHLKNKDNEKASQPVNKSGSQETDVTLEETASVFQPHNILNSIENQQVVIKNEDESNLVDDKSAMDTDIDMLKNNIPDENSEVPVQETQNISENMFGPTELLQENQKIPVANADIGDMAIGGGGTETGNLIESMLAAMLNDG